MRNVYLFAAILILSIQSCKIEKRVHANGYYFSHSLHKSKKKAAVKLVHLNPKQASDLKVIKLDKNYIPIELKGDNILSKQEYSSLPDRIDNIASKNKSTETALHNNRELETAEISTSEKTRLKKQISRKSKFFSTSTKYVLAGTLFLILGIGLFMFGLGFFSLASSYTSTLLIGLLSALLGGILLIIGITKIEDKAFEEKKKKEKEKPKTKNEETTKTRKLLKNVSMLAIILGILRLILSTTPQGLILGIVTILAGVSFALIRRTYKKEEASNESKSSPEEDHSSDIQTPEEPK
jgi:F0F1-type ATP synthase assembly protein I